GKVRISCKREKLNAFIIGSTIFGRGIPTIGPMDIISKGIVNIMDIPKRFESCFILFLFSHASLLVNYLESQLFLIRLHNHYWIQHQSHQILKLLTGYKKLAFFLSLN